MQHTMHQDAWIKEFNDIIRYKIFPDVELRELMQVPKTVTIIPFLEKYFVKAGYTDEVLTDEKVRIVYSSVTAYDTDVPNVKRNALNFDIYVRTDQNHNVSEDRLQSRGELIALKLKQMQCDKRYVDDTGYRFWPKTEADLGTKTVGYTRHHISFWYMRVM